MGVSVSLVILPEAVRTATCRNNGSVHHSEGAGVYVRLIFGVALLILVTAVSEVSAESIQYEIVALHWWGNELIAKGTYEYTVRDVRVTELATGDAHVWQKSVKIWGEYAIGASVYREASLDGFGLWVQKGQHGFSWDWFDRESKDVYRKLQGPGVFVCALPPHRTRRKSRPWSFSRMLRYAGCSVGGRSLIPTMSLFARAACCASHPDKEMNP